MDNPSATQGITEAVVNLFATGRTSVTVHTNSKQSDTRMRNGAQHLPGSREYVIRETNREICTHLRDDWKWPQASRSENRIDSDTKWRERALGSASPSPPSSPNPYRYDSPDSVSHQVSADKSKRLEELLAETKWNDGLKTYINRRNDWTGGTFSQGLPSASGPLATSVDLDQAIDHNIGPFTTTRSADSMSSLIEIVPIPQPIIVATNPIRATITPQSYTKIYDKVVEEGITPKIPINLADMTRAITAGWKAHGEWPPTAEPTQPAPIASRRKKKEGATEEHRRTLTMRGVERMKKVLRLKDEEGDDVEEEQVEIV